jgi:hypothetical protein
MSAPHDLPALIIVLPFEGKPKILTSVMSETDRARLRDWLCQSDDALAEALSAFLSSLRELAGTE